MSIPADGRQWRAVPGVLALEPDRLGPNPFSITHMLYRFYVMYTLKNFDKHFYNILLERRFL